MVSVDRLGYVGWNVTDLKAWDDLLCTVYGLELRKDKSRKKRHYRVDDRLKRISLCESNKDDVRFIGWEVDTHEQLQEVEKQLIQCGVHVRRGTQAQIRDRQVMDLISFEDPDGFNTEVFYAAIEDGDPFKASYGRAGFVTGPLGLGHVVLTCKDVKTSCDFYRRALGFNLSDHIHWPDGEGKTAEATFLHCNPRHHSVALVNESFGCKGGEFNHLMLEAKSLEDVGCAYDVVQEKNYPIALTLGCHTNDRMVSFYLHTPSGWLIEYGWGGRLIDSEEWEIKIYNSPKVWGHVGRPAPKHWKISK